MAYDLVILNGKIVDGTGAAAYEADVGVRGGRIVTIGKLAGEDAAEIIDAAGQVVAPGFIDGHTHMDAQVFWDPLGTCSAWHGVTSAIMGNCGFTLAPCAKKDRAFVIKNLERAEDISRDAMEAGIEWTWETFPEYLDAVEALPKGINYGGYVGHSAIRTYVMRERAFTEKATPDDIEKMKHQIRISLEAGAAGFTTSRSPAHRTPEGGPVASVVADWDEVVALVGVLGEMGRGVFELTLEGASTDPEKSADLARRTRELAIDAGVRITHGVASQEEYPKEWRNRLRTIEETVAAGGSMKGQVSGKPLNSVLSFETMTPFDGAPFWSEIRALPLDEQIKAFRDPEQRRRLVEEANSHVINPEDVAGPEARQAEYESIFVLDKPLPPYRSIASIARETGKNPVDVMIDLALEKDFKLFFLQEFANKKFEDVREMISHPEAIMTFSDSGAHVSQLIDFSIQTNFLGYWVREQKVMSLEAAVKKMTSDLADFWKLTDRGRLVEGGIADIVVFDPDTISPTMPSLVHDLPAGARRLVQKAIGIAATIVAGTVLVRNGEHTGAYPGQLLRMA